VVVYNKETGEEDILDICMVYNGSSCGLNQVLWAPWFALPTADPLLLCTVDMGYWGANNDYGEIFLNFWLHRDLWSYCGVDLTAHFPEELEGSSRKVIWEVWTCPPMGIRPSPYQAVQGALIVKRLSLGTPTNVDNIFQWEKLDLNLPGDHGYRTGDPWILKQ
jgi:hypothetical protein